MGLLCLSLSAVFAYSLLFICHARELPGAKVRPSLKTIGQVAQATVRLSKFNKNTITGLQKAGQLLSKIGPLFGAAGFVFKVVEGFTPSPTDLALQQIQKTLGELNTKLDFINYKLDDLDTLVKYMAVSATFNKYIQNMYVLKNKLDNYLTAPTKRIREGRRWTSQREINKEEFLRAYTSEFGSALTKLYLGIVNPSRSPINLYLFDNFANRYKCNVVKIGELCAYVGRVVADGMQINAAYYALRGNKHTLTREARAWIGRTNEIGQKCQQAIDNCIKDGYRKYADQLIETKFDSLKRERYTKITSTMTNTLLENFPHMRWLSIVNEETTGDGNHYYRSNTYVKTVWHKYDVALTVAGVTAMKPAFNHARSRVVSDEAFSYASRAWCYQGKDKEAKVVADRIYGAYHSSSKRFVYLVSKDLDKNYNDRGSAFVKTYYDGRYVKECQRNNCRICSNIKIYYQMAAYFIADK